MSLSMYQASAPAFLQTLNNLSAILDKAEAYAANLQGLIHAARKDLKTPNLLFVCIRLRAGQPKDKPR